MSVVERSHDRVVESLLASVKQLPPPDLERFARAFREWQATKSSENDDAALLALIETSSHLPASQQQRFEELRRKRQSGQLTPGEDKELHSLWDRSEELSVTCLGAMMDLARLRGVDVDALMQDHHLDLPTSVF